MQEALFNWTGILSQMSVMHIGELTHAHPHFFLQAYLCFIEFPRSLRGICGDQRGTERVSGEEETGETGRLLCFSFCLVKR